MYKFKVQECGIVCEVARSQLRCTEQQQQQQLDRDVCNASCVYELVPQHMLTDEARNGTVEEYGRLRGLVNCNADCEAAALNILFGSKMKQLVSSVLSGKNKSDQGDLMLFNEQYIVKPSRSGESGSFPWHRDADSLFSALKGEAEDSLMVQYVSVWIALDDMTAENGCLRIRPKSHIDYTTETVATCMKENVELQVSAGTAVVMHHMVEHCSGPNMTQFERRAWMPQYSCGPICMVTPISMTGDQSIARKSPISLAIPI